MTDLAKRKHPSHDAWFTELSLGAASWSGLGGAEGDAVAAEIIADAWEAGIRYFDTAPYYGSGLCERRLGNGLVWKTPSDFLLSTKVGVNLDPFGRGKPLTRHYRHYADFIPVCDYSEDGIRQSFETSLHRMGIPAADIAYMHGLSICGAGMEEALESGMPALLRLRDAGHVRMVGVGANTPAIAMAFLERYDLDLLLFAGGFSLMDHRGAETVIAKCEQRNIGIIAASPFASGRYFFEENTAFRVRLQSLCSDFKISENAAVIQFALRYRPVLSVLWSTKNPHNVTRTVASLQEVIPDGFWDAARNVGLLHF
jgi:D-threo-aldose 1-dehydrogenase